MDHNNRLALVIGNSEYQDQKLQQLIAPSQDAEALARVLANPRIGNFQVKILINHSSAEILQEIEGFLSIASMTICCSSTSQDTVLKMTLAGYFLLRPTHSMEDCVLLPYLQLLFKM